MSRRERIGRLHVITDVTVQTRFSHEELAEMACAGGADVIQLRDKQLDDSAFLAVGIEINANHVRGVREGRVHGTARPVHVGRATQIWEIRIVDDSDRLVCISRLTVSVVPKPPGR